ncbi:RHS repeat-associated core domain-containing protein [Acinetobacter genomosp. 15BJ]|uniref:RHS repeat-associated core domain-containing protein n=1 Tax=Acinetobacter genomosp. 15BJ TaxID=106651 RepID=R9B003_9GAMM|nr:RHS repeat-associated core domain-containing protein [Acinetobacter genomosp. 15BJ]EOR07620.1 hypothetical protein F896_01993 [Acinetobacter genomosp. 15BJ]MCH7292182.1 hypothetical protein [Acinetobacter genomosp. 15BJ]MDO3656111.1 RHS repeat-associated core domain-containing protein [Acinetobacter genomosp. 15BJ]
MEIRNNCDVKALERNAAKPMLTSFMASDESGYSSAPTYNALGYEIDPRTGTLQATISPPTIFGPLGNNITPSIVYSPQSIATGNSFLGLPLGWTYSFSYIMASKVYINGQSAYFIDDEYESGLRYYNLKNLNFTDNSGALPYDKNLQYHNTLQFANGELHYFDIYGRLIGIADRWGNHAIFYYDRDGDVYNCKLSSIVSFAGKMIIFSYKTESIQVNYPQGAKNDISFTYLIDSENYLVGFVNPIGQKFVIANKGGLVRNDLISQIIYPNGLSIAYEYTTVHYYADQTRSQFYRIDCVSASKQMYVDNVGQSQTRTITYSYNPNGDNHNYTGYPTYIMGEYTDTLLQSRDDDYRYITHVDDGIFVTEHQYNRLHLEIITKTYTKDTKQRLIKQTTNTFQSETDGKYFPPYNELRLIPNYQTPIKVTTDIFNDTGNILSTEIESDFDDYGSPTEVRSYTSTKGSNTPKLISKVSTTYDNTNYGQIIKKDSYDYTDVIIIRRVANSLTSDKKNIAMSIDGFVELESGEEIFKPEKKITFRYNVTGRITYQKLEWDDGKTHALLSTETSTCYTLNDTVLTITSTNAQGTANTIEIDSITGWLINQMDALNQGFSYTYDNVGRKVTSTNPLGVTTTWIFEDEINKATTKYANGYETYIYNNGFNNTIRTADNGGRSKQAERILTSQSFNDKGQLIWNEGILAANSRITYTYNSRNELSALTDALGNVTRFEYDSVEQVKTEFFNEVKVTKLSKNNNMLNEITYSNLQASIEISATSFSNIYSNIVKSLIGNQTMGNEWLATSFQYDVNNQVSGFTTTGSDKITSRQNISRDLFTNAVVTSVCLSIPGTAERTAKGDTFFYNNLNQLITDTNPLGQYITYTYNEIGQVSSYTDYAGVVFTCQYTANNQLALVEWYDGKVPCKKQYTYDPPTQKISKIEEFYQNVSKGYISYNYILNGAIESLTYPDGKTIFYEYDKDTGLLSRFTDAIGNITQYTYDIYGRLKQQKIAGSNYSVVTNYYDKKESAVNSGKIKSVQISNGVVSNFNYDGFGLLTQTVVTDISHSDQIKILQQTQYTYDPVTKNIVNLQSSSEAFPQDASLNYIVNYGYNSLNQLIIEQKKILDGDLTITQYQYDAASNVIREDHTVGTIKQSITYSYDLDNKLLCINSDAGIRYFSYDANGNLIDDGAGCIYSYDAQNRLVSYKDNKNKLKAEYDYYPNGLRASKKVENAEEIRFYYDYSQYPSIINEIQGSKTCHYLLQGNKRYIRLVSNAQNTTAEYFIASFKDIIAVLNATSELEASYSYTPYGQEIESSHFYVDIDINPFRYTTEYTDLESSLIYLRARYYHPDIKRFMSRDTAQLINRYNYANGNPIMANDPSGNLGVGWIIGAALAGIAVGLLTGGVGALALGTGLSASIAVGVVAGVTGTAASNGITAWGLHASGEQALSAKDWGVSLLAGAVAGTVGAGIGGVSGRAVMRTAMNAGWSATTVTAVGVLTAAGSGGFTGSVASAGVTAGLNDENFFSADIWENIAISTVVSIGAGVMAAGAHFGGGRLGTIPVEAEAAEISLITMRHQGRTILELNISEAGQWQNKNPIQLSQMTGGHDTVIVHGHPRFSFPEDLQLRPRYASAQTTAQVIKNTIPAPAVNAPIRLISCYAGRAIGVENMAQTIANTLGRNVEAYTIAISISEVINGTVTPVTFRPI